MLTDPIADMLTRIRNAIWVRHPQVTVPYSTLKESVLKVFQQEGLIGGFEVVGEKYKKVLAVRLKYMEEGKSTLSTLRKVSTPGRRVFCGAENLKPLRSGLGVRVVSTSKGVMSDNEARKQKIGGEVLVEAW
ncbi:MAG: 30S ribosomal protein S8 [Deltaproteobacteria bacterium]|nr:30S ribosomal protein S8 [Deltaproteobacteria bacterium]